MRRAASEWRTTFEAISDAVAVIDSHGVVERANRAFAARFGDVVGRRVTALEGARSTGELALGERLFSVRFDVVVESSKIGVRKPEPTFYATACELLGVEPSECVFLDDLGINLKPAKAMGMTTIKVGEPGPAIAELAQVLGISLT